MKGTLATTRALLTAGLLLLLSGSLQAATIAWDDGDGGSGTLAGSWDNLQAAINSAQGAGNAGWVKISGDLARNAAVTTTGDLEVTAGNVAISGGWDAGFTSQSGLSTLNVNAADIVTDNFRVMEITGSRTTLDSLKLTGGGLYAYKDVGAGLYVHDTQYIRVSRCEITGNTLKSTYDSHGAGLYVYNSGASVEPVLIENCKITNNTSVGAGVNGGGLSLGRGANTVFIAVVNSEITGNTASAGAGASLCLYKSRALVFGSVIANNSNIDEFNGVDGAGVRLWNARTYDYSYIANCTIADNVDATDANSQGVKLEAYGASYNYHSKTNFINAILAENQGVRVEDGETSLNTSAAARFQRSTIYEPVGSQVYYEVDLDGIPGDVSTNDLATALAWTSPESRFHSVDDSGADQQTIQNELTTDPSFVGSGDYQLTVGSNSLDNGMTRTGTHADITGSFLYVDTDMDDAYDAAWDVIVDLQGATVGGTAMHLVYETDLLGNARVHGGGIDRGAYEWVPEPATMGLLGLGLAGLAVRRRRRRRT